MLQPKDRKFTGDNALLNLAGHLRKVERDYLPRFEMLVLDRVGNDVGLDARERIIGRLTPLPQTGPFVAWAPLKRSTIDQKRRYGLGKFENPNSMLWATGELAKSVTYEVFKGRGKSEVHVGSDVPYVGFLEKGTVRMPHPRPIFGPAMFRTVPKLMPSIEHLLACTILGDRPHW